MGTPALAGTRVYRNHHLDSTRWDDVRFRDDDIVVTTPYKTGTTWTQQILCALIHGPDRLFGQSLSPWIDARFWGPLPPVLDALEAQEHRRFVKSHLALDGMRWDARVRYVVVGRDTRDVFMSLFNHYGSYTDLAMAAFNDADRPGAPLPDPPTDPHELWANWITRGWFEWERDGWPFWSNHHHLETWWTARDEPNVLFVHYADLLADPHTEIARLARFCDIDVDTPQLDAVVEATSFGAMKKQMIAQEGGMGMFFEGGANTFMHKGTNGRWTDVLDDSELALYEQRAADFDPDFRRWLEQGRDAIGMA